ncbi:MAG: hypothetical protein HKL96_09615 [Phycisphaerales bacterium]|nr:hypothetical protein [Phycisphaerales bacterium]
MVQPVRLSREIRFGLHDSTVVTKSPNSFAGNPPLFGIAPFLTLMATVEGRPDANTGMLINIKQVDEHLRKIVANKLQRHYIDTGHTRRLFSGVEAIQRLHASARNLFSPLKLQRLRLSISPYLYYEYRQEEVPLIIVAQRFEFSAAHRLHSSSMSEQENLHTFGKCNNPNGHGHNYELEVAIAREAGTPAEAGLTLAELQEVVNREVINRFDHKNLNLDCEEFASLNPTVENIAQTIFDRLQLALVSRADLQSVKVWETPKTFCEVCC